MPSHVYPNGLREWTTNGVLDRSGDRPAVIHPDGSLEYWRNGKRHRVGGPAVVFKRGKTKTVVRRHPDCLVLSGEGWNHGKRVVYDGKCITVWKGDMEQWWCNGKLDRADGGPAITWYNGTREWWINGKRSRLNGLPAIEYPDGTREWWVNGVYLYTVAPGKRYNESPY
jgi:hypothetical protein